ncbi:MAG: lamin tail domain-containing protein, partial [Planctomycetota bacterium]
MGKNRRLPVPESGKTRERGPATSVRISFLSLALALSIAGLAGVSRTESALSAEVPAPGEITLVINEIMAGNDGSIRDQRGDADDWIEIYNYGDAAVDMGGFYLTDDLSEPDAWRVPGNDPTLTTVPARGYLLIWADGEPGEGTLHAGFKLDADGEQVGLYSAGGSLIDSLTFGPQDTDESYGRVPDGADKWRLIDTPTPAASNTGGTVDVVINEIMYHPPSAQNQPEDIRHEYIELFNRGTATVNLSGWRFSNAVDFVLPDVTLAPRQYLVVAANVNAFEAVYPGVSNAVGGWDGKLSNSGETIELVDSAGVIIDSLRYGDQGDWGLRELGPNDRGHRGWLWVTQHDGRGKSLELINPALPNQHGQNWLPGKYDGGTPGAVNSVSDDDIAPLIVDVEHLPIIPGADDPVTVSARIIDEASSGVTAALRYRVDTSVYEDESIYRRHDTSDYQVVWMFD